MWECTLTTRFLFSLGLSGLWTAWGEQILGWGGDLLNLDEQSVPVDFFTSVCILCLYCLQVSTCLSHCASDGS